MSGLAGYDAWKLATPPEYERGAAVESLIDGDEHLSRLQRRADIAADRADKLTKKLAATPQSDYRDRLALVLREVARQAKYRANDLQAAIEESADEGPDYDDLRDSREDR